MTYKEALKDNIMIVRVDKYGYEMYGMAENFEYDYQLDDDYTSGISNTQRLRCLGNAFNVDVVAHIFSKIKDGVV